MAKVYKVHDVVMRLTPHRREKFQVIGMLSEWMLMHSEVIIERAAGPGSKRVRVVKSRYGAAGPIVNGKVRDARGDRWPIPR